MRFPRLIVSTAARRHPFRTAHARSSSSACGIASCSLCGDAVDALPTQRERVSSLALNRPARFEFDEVYGRRMWNGVASESECRRAVEAARQAMLVACDTDGDGRLFPPDAPSAETYLGSSGLALIMGLRSRVDDSIREQYGNVERMGCLLSWISGRGDLRLGERADGARQLKSFNWLSDPVSGTFAPHVDCANQPIYELSALLYLSSYSVDFRGGLFAFNDADCDRLVEPEAGRLLAFCSGYRNLHQVRPVLAGDRFVLSTWYRRVLRDEQPP